MLNPEWPPKSRMWESRLSGSERGVGGNWYWGFATVPGAPRLLDSGEGEEAERQLPLVAEFSFDYDAPDETKPEDLEKFPQSVVVGANRLFPVSSSSSRLANGPGRLRYVAPRVRVLSNSERLIRR